MTDLTIHPRGTTDDAFHSPVYCLHADLFDDSDRVRSQVGDIREFAKRLKQEGQLNPITFEWVEVDGERRIKLNTGARRLYAAQLLAIEDEFFGMELPEGDPRRVDGAGFILARDVGELTEIDRLVLEMSENDSRKDFTKSEQALGYAKLRRLLQERDGKPVSVHDLAEKLKTSVGQVGMGLKVAAAIEKDPTSELAKKLLSKPSVKAAYDHLRTDTKLKEIRGRLAGAKPVSEDVAQAIGHPDGIAFLKSLADETVDFIFFDPPWGIGVDDYDRTHKHETFTDDYSYAWDKVIVPMIPELYRVLKPDTWSIVWFGIQFYQRMVDALETLVGAVPRGRAFTVDPVPGIWYKTNKGGSQNNPDIIELNVYEPFLRIRKGDPRLFKKPLKNVIECPMDFGDSREHFAQKPLMLCTEMLERYTSAGMLVVDPTYGSGRILKAAQKMKRRFAGAEKNAENREKTLLLLGQGSISDALEGLR